MFSHSSPICLSRMVKIEKSPDFNDMTAGRLTCWRVSIPVVLANKHKPIIVNDIQSESKLFLLAIGLAFTLPTPIPPSYSSAFVSSHSFNISLQSFISIRQRFSLLIANVLC